MAKFTLPKNSKIENGVSHPMPTSIGRTKSFKITVIDEIQE